MLSKNNKILIGCLALLLVMSVGYALFSDTITINGTAIAKGDFDITATCETGISSKLGTPESLDITNSKGYQNDTCSVVDDTVSLNVEFLYPGARRNFTVKYTNTGTIDATISMSDFEGAFKLCVADNVEGENNECITKNGKPLVEGSSLTLKGYSANLALRSQNFFIEDSEGNLFSVSDSKGLEFYDANTGTLTLKSGYSVYAIQILWLDHSFSMDHTSNEMFVEYTASIGVPFKQAQ